MKATCIITNCRNSAPASEPFCAYHRDKPRPKVEAIEVRARSAIEAQHSYNDVFPGDLVMASVGDLAQEAVRLALKQFEATARHEIKTAFEQGKDFLLEYSEMPHRHPAEWSIVATFRGRAVEPGTVDGERLPMGMKLFRLVDWRDRI